MPNQSGKIVLVLVLFLLLIGAAAYFLLLGFKKQENTGEIINSSIQPSASLLETNKPSGLFRKYSSKDLKVSFEYPMSWFLNEKDFEIMITSFETKFGENRQPTEAQIKVFISEYGGGCHKTIDKNLKDPACGEGGLNIKPNEILSKETQDIDGAKFHKYLIKYPNGKQQNFYFLEKGDQTLQIDKNPDPSMFDKEFEDIIQSIKFLEE